MCEEEMQLAFKRVQFSPRLYVHVKEAEEALLADLKKSIANKVQGSDDLLPFINKLLSSFGYETEEQGEALARTVMDTLDSIAESVIYGLYFAIRARGWVELIMVFNMTWKMLVPGSISMRAEKTAAAFTWLKEFATAEGLYEENDVQGFVSSLKIIRDGIKFGKDLVKTKVFRHADRLMRYCLSFGLFQSFGLTFDNMHFDELEAKRIKREHTDKIDFAMEVLDGLSFILDRAIQAVHLKSWIPLFHSSDTYSKWVTSVFKCKEQFELYKAEHISGVSYATVLGDLSKTIEEGESIFKFATEDSFEKNCVSRYLSEMRLLKCNLLTKADAQKIRKMPFTALIHGDSSVGKTLFQDVLFEHFSRIRDLPHGDEYRYNRNPLDAFWSGYNPAMWCIVFDDAAMLNPNKMAGIDPSVGEMVCVCNPNPTNAPMADLSEKGKCPIRCELVVATTNVRDLHATTYYSYPLALQRRFPYVIDVEPRITGVDCRRKDSPTMIDTNVCPAVLPGEYPNQWKITISEVKAKAVTGGKTQATIVPLENGVYEDIYEFLDWFTEAVNQHELQTTAVQVIAKNMKSEIWKESACAHFLPRHLCSRCKNLVQQDYFDAQESNENDLANYLDTYPEILEVNQVTGNSFADEAAGLFEETTGLFIHSCHYAMKQIKAGLATVESFVSEKLKCWLVCQMKNQAMTMIGNMGDKLYKAGAAVSPLFYVVAAIPLAIGLLSLPSLFSREDPEPVKEPQGANLSASIGKRFETDKPDEKPNVWYNSQFEASSFDIPLMTSSWKGKTVDEISQLLRNNMISIHFQHILEDGNTFGGDSHALALGGHLYVTDSHLFAPAKLYRLKIVHGMDCDGMNVNKTLTIDEASLYRVPGTELVFFELAIPPKANIIDLIPSASYYGKFDGFQMKRESNGFVSHMKVKALQLLPSYIGNPVNLHMDVWRGQAEHKTDNGDCGSTLIGMSPAGPLVIGLHIAGGVTNEVESIRLSKEVIISAQRHFETPIVNTNTVRIDPKNPVQSLHHKSVFRYIENGTAQVFGSVAIRPSFKSDVYPTVLAPHLEKYGWKQAHGAPVLKGYEPWRQAALPAVQKKGLIEPGRLRRASKAYLADLIRNIPDSAFAELMVLDNGSALNGTPGVKFLEKMNRKSSMGYPFNKSKRFFLLDVPESDYWADAKDFTPEVWDEVDTIIKDYQEGRVSHPVFVGHLKDEALPFKKIVAMKTRVFLIAPAAWTLVVRKYLLTFVRMFQRYGFVTEGMPGLAAQSSAWGRVYDHLTKYGDKNMVAGDFRAFDKGMFAIIMAEVFWIIRKIHEHAGYSEESILIIQCIAEDTIYNMCIFNGDLVMFDGSNPSGGPLTVVINCIANSIYMRYVFSVIVISVAVEQFQLFVALITYGDDNAMGVHDDIPEFNHTSIQKAFLDIGVEYTMADKSDGSIPYIPIEKVDFLKRSWRWDSEIKGWMAPLDETSIKKCLMIGTVSKAVSREFQAIANIGSAVREYFFYGRTIYDEKKWFFHQLAQDADLEAYVQSSTFPTYDELVEDWKMASQIDEEWRTSL